MKPQYFDSQKAAAIISEPNDDRRSLMVDALTGDEAKLLCKLLLEFVPRKRRAKRSASGRSIERAHCMHANEKEGWFAVKKLLLTAGIALTVLLLLVIFLWFGPYGTQLL